MPETGGVFGRGRELGAVAAFLDGLPSGPSGLLLEGEAGIGKTTVWSVGVAEAAARSYLVLSSRPAQAEAKLSFAALADLLDGVLERVLAALAEPSAWRFHANHIEALIGLGDLDRAGELLGWLEGRGRVTGRRWTLATAARCRGLLLAAQGDTPGAVRALDEALRHHQDLGMPFELGRTLLIAGQIQRRAKRKALARRHLEQALGIFESLPAAAWAARARAELSRIGLRPPAPLELTATEERVAILAASGRTNRQVAATGHGNGPDPDPAAGSGPSGGGTG